MSIKDEISDLQMLSVQTVKVPTWWIWRVSVLQTTPSRSSATISITWTQQSRPSFSDSFLHDASLTSWVWVILLEYTEVWDLLSLTQFFVLAHLQLKCTKTFWLVWYVCEQVPQHWDPSKRRSLLLQQVISALGECCQPQPNIIIWLTECLDTRSMIRYVLTWQCATAAKLY